VQQIGVVCDLEESYENESSLSRAPTLTFSALDDEGMLLEPLAELRQSLLLSRLILAHIALVCLHKTLQIHDYTLD
jgi:hypothetical protein